jgi:cold shock CspA family protein
MIRTGVLKFYSASGYGMIVPDDRGPDVFFRHEACHVARSIKLNGGDRMRYVRADEPSPKGWYATDVWLDWPAVDCPACKRRPE